VQNHGSPTVDRPSAAYREFRNRPNRHRVTCRSSSTRRRDPAWSFIVFPAAITSRICSEISARHPLVAKDLIRRSRISPSRLLSTAACGVFPHMRPPSNGRAPDKPYAHTRRFIDAVWQNSRPPTTSVPCEASAADRQGDVRRSPRPVRQLIPMRRGARSELHSKLAGPI